MRSRLAVLALVCWLAACNDETPSTPQPVPVQPGPVVTIPGSNLGLSADSICMQALLGGANPHDDDVRITSLTGSDISGLTATITYGPGQPTGWLSTSFDKTTTEARLWLHVTTGSVPEGAWWADVSVSAPDGGAPRVIRMHFTVLPAGMATITVGIGGFSQFDESPGDGLITGNGFHCDSLGGTCTQQFPIGTVLTLLATPKEETTLFFFWQVPGCGFDNNPCVVTVTGDSTLPAFFRRLHYTVGVTVVGDQANGIVTGYITPGGPGRDIECSLVNGVQTGTCGAEQWYGARALGLDAHAFDGSVFVGWSGDCTGSSTSCLLPGNPGGSYHVTATFAKQ